MNIKFHKNACFSIKDGDITIVTDPHEKAAGALKAKVVTVSHQQPDRKVIDLVQGEPRVFDWPGEYETAGVHFKGIASFHNPKESKEQKENTVFLFEWKGIRLCHLGSLGTNLTSEQLEEIGDVDILFIPVGGTETIDSKKAKEVIEQIEPRIIIPMAYCADDDDKCGLGPLEPFLTEMSAQKSEPVEEFVLKRSELPDDASKVVVINPS